MERARRKLDMAQSEYKAGWNPPYLHTRAAGNYRLQGKHGLAIGYTLLVRCGPTLKHWQSCVNVAARETFPEVRRFIQTKPIFRLADKHYLGVGESTKLDLTSACAEAAAVVSIGKRPYFEWRMAFAEVAAAQCPPWNIMRAAQDALVANLDKACVDSKGPLGVVAGVICDPSWITHFLLQQKHLVDGVDLKLKEVAGERYGLVFERVPFEVMLALHNPLVVKRIEEAPWPEKEALLVVSEAIYGDGRLVDDPSAVVPRLGWLRGPNRWGSAEVEHRTAILSLTSETDRQALQAAIETRKLAGKLHQVIKNNDVFKNEDGLVLFSIVTSTTEAANMGTQAQLCYHFRQMRHSPQFCFPFAFYQGDDEYPPYSAHARNALPNDPIKYPTLHRALQDMCNSPFELADGRLVTFCGPHVPDYKASFKLTGLGKGPRSKTRVILNQATPQQMGAGSGPLLSRNLVGGSWSERSLSNAQRAREQIREQQPGTAR